ncbi:MAG: acylphosphatase [Chloroflexota bacterium]
MTDQARLEAVVHGRVHGVGFRVFVRRIARELGLQGWVANESANQVRFVAEGPRAELDRLLAAAESGPPAAYVERVAATWPRPTGTLIGFEIRSGSHSGD